MLFFVGLGNPGKKYELTRHNVGFWVIDQVVKKQTGLTFQNSPKFFAETWRNQEMFLAKPQTFMNESGKSVQAILNFFKELKSTSSERHLKQLYVIHDDLDLEVGTYKIQYGKGPKVHNGLSSLYHHLHTENFWHVRVGVDGRKGDRSIPGHEYVLSQFSADEKKLVEQVINDICRKLPSSSS